MINIFQKILVLAPHPDDGELGCGGTIARCIEQGAQVYYAVFSPCRQSLPQHLPEDTREIEVRRASQLLGVRSDNLFMFNFDVRMFRQHRQEILEVMLHLRQILNPDLVLLPCSTDIHQDHQTVYEEALRAFKHTSMLGYEMPWNNFSVHASTFVQLEDYHVEAKVRALGVYESQLHRNYVDDTFVRSLAVTRGIQIGARFAEAFEVIRWILSLAAVKDDEAVLQRAGEQSLDAGRRRRRSRVMGSAI